MIAYYNHTPVYYKVYGNGPALVLLHGFLESSTMWEMLIPKLSKKNKVITLDLPGHGNSGYISETHTMELMAEVVNTIMENLNITRANFMGHSMGGYVILAYVEKYNTKVNKLILLNSTTVEDSIERKQNRDRALSILKTNPKTFIGLAMKNFFAESTRDKFTVEIEKLKNEALLFPLNGITAAIKGMKHRKNRTQILKNFSQEKFFICGIEDPIIPISTSEKLAKLSKAKLFRVEGGHMSVYENYEEIVKILHFIDFL